MDCGPSIPTANRWLLRAMAFMLGGGGILYALVGEPVAAVAAVVITALLWAPLLVLSLPRHTLLCEGGVATASHRARWSEIVAWETYDAGNRLSLMVRRSAERLEEVSIGARLTQSQAEAEQVLRARVPHGRVLL